MPDDVVQGQLGDPERGPLHVPRRACRRAASARAHLDLDADVGALLDALGQPLDAGEEAHLLEHDGPPRDEQRLDLVHRGAQVRGQPLHRAARLGLGEGPPQRRQHLRVEVGGEPAPLVLRGLGPARLAPRDQLVHEDPHDRERVAGPAAHGDAGLARRDSRPRPGERPAAGRAPGPIASSAPMTPSHAHSGTPPRSPPSVRTRKLPTSTDPSPIDQEPGERDDGPRPPSVVRRVGGGDGGRHEQGNDHQGAEGRDRRAPVARPCTSRTRPTAPSADAVDPITAAHQAIVGAHEWVRTITTSAPMPQRCGTRSEGVGSGAAERVQQPQQERPADEGRRGGRRESRGPGSRPCPSRRPTPRAAPARRAPCATARRTGRTAAAGGSPPSSRSRPAARRSRRSRRRRTGAPGPPSRGRSGAAARCGWRAASPPRTRCRPTATVRIASRISPTSLVLMRYPAAPRSNALRISGGWSNEDSSRTAGPSARDPVQQAQALGLAGELHVADHDIHPVRGPPRAPRVPRRASGRRRQGPGRGRPGRRHPRRRGSPGGRPPGARGSAGSPQPGA